MLKSKISKLVVLFLLWGCAGSSQSSYIIRHKNNGGLFSIHYFSKEGIETSRTWGKKNGDSITFNKDGQNLEVKEYHYDFETKKRHYGGTIFYENYFAKVTDIQTFGNVLYVNVTPITNNRYFRIYEDIVKVLGENCIRRQVGKQSYFENCDFSLPKDLTTPYVAENAVIHAGKSKFDSKNRIENLELNAFYNDRNILYSINFRYSEKNAVQTTKIRDSLSEETFIDNYEGPASQRVKTMAKRWYSPLLLVF